MTVRALTLSVRALREGARRKAPFLLRGLLIATMFLAVWAAHEASQYANFGGIMLLSWVAWCDFVLIMLLAVSAFSAVITEEKELMSLGLLRLAGFTPASILLGKSVGILVSALLLLVVQVPFCMLAVTLGGVTVAQVVGVFTMLLAFLIFAYGLAMLCSVISSRNSTAARQTALLLLAYHILPPLLYFLIDEVVVALSTTSGFGWFLHEATVTSALHGLGALTSTMGGFGTASFGTHSIVNLSMGVGLLGLSWMLFDRCNRNEVPSAPARSVLLPWKNRSGKRSSHRSWDRALVWKDFRFLSGGTIGLVVRGLIYVLLVALVIGTITIAGGDMDPEDVGGFLMVTMTFLFVLELGIAAGRVFQQEVKSKTLGALVSLPHSLGYVVFSKILGAAMITIPSLGFFGIGFLLSSRDFGKFLEQAAPEPVAWYCVSQFVLGLFLTMYYSLRFTRGAFALALASIALGNMIFWMGGFAITVGGADEDPMACFGVPLSIFLCFLLARGIVGRLRKLASEE